VRFNWIEVGEPTVVAAPVNDDNGIENQDLVVAVVISSLLTVTVTVITTLFALKYIGVPFSSESMDVKRLMETSR
jgi:hypothetical protein